MRDASGTLSIDDVVLAVRSALSGFRLIRYGRAYENRCRVTVEDDRDLLIRRRSFATR
jgi:hypothetical protein